MARCLGKALFREAVRDAFVTARNESGDDLRTLFVVEDAELKPLHWERLCAPIRAGGKWGLLGRDQRSIFSLYLPSLADRRFPAIGAATCAALVLVADPRGGTGTAWIASMNRPRWPASAPRWAISPAICWPVRPTRSAGPRSTSW